MRIPGTVSTLLELLTENGYEAYVVGGCVRDTLLGLTPHDWDICTSASPEEMMTVFADYPVIETGIKHGTITVTSDGMPIEITTFRTDGEYKDHRHPDSVVFVKTLQEDLARRDFTVNAMAYHPKCGLQDPFGGREDLAQRVLRCVGNAEQRFCEDALRILRGLRFAATYGFIPEEETSAALLQCAPLLTSVSEERVQAELCRMLIGDYIGDVLQKYYTVLFPVLPEWKACEHFEQFSPYHDRDVLEHTITAIAGAVPDLLVRLTLLLHDIGKPLCFSKDEKGNGHFFGHAKISEEMAGDILRRLRFDTKTIHDVCVLIRHHDTIIEQNEVCVKRWLNRLGQDLFETLILVKDGDCKGHAPCLLEPRMTELAELCRLKEKIIEESQCFSLKDLAINGTDIMRLGFTGKAVGEQLQWALLEVIEQRLPNDKETLLAAVSKKA